MILPNTDFEGAYEAAERIMETLNKEMSEIPNCSVSPKLSIGLATYQHGENPEDLIRRVDNALYESKNNERNCIP